MSGKPHVKSDNCVCDTVRAIYKMQEAAEDRNDCDNNCYDLLNSTGGKSKNKYTTVPFSLYDKQGNPFTITGYKKGESGCAAVETSFFRVSKMLSDCCAVLELLKDESDYYHDGGDDIDGSSERGGSYYSCPSLKRTRICVTVDLKCFCAIQCHDPAFVTNS